MSYEPRNPHHLRYVADFKPSQERLNQMEEIVLKINQYLGYDLNTVELAVRDGVPYAIDFCNPAPDAERTSVGQENFEGTNAALHDLAKLFFAGGVKLGDPHVKGEIAG